MPIHQLTLDSLKSLDMGKAAEAFQQHIRRAAVDCMDRPGDDAARKVTLEIALKPVQEPDGTCDEVTMQIHVSSAIPKHRTKPYSCGLHRNGVVVFNEDSPDNINQTTFLGDDDEEDSA